MVFNLEYITEYINRKIAKNEKIIIIKYYELKVKEGLTDEQIQYFADKSKIRLFNLGYTIYEEGDSYYYDGKMNLIENNILYVAIKDKI